MIHVLYFASIREQLNCAEEDIALSSAIQNISQLKSMLSERDKNWQNTFQNNQYLTAINQTIADDHTQLKDGDEVAFFPQVTGG